MSAPIETEKSLHRKTKTKGSCNLGGWITVAGGFVLFAVTISPSNSYSILFVTLQETFNASAVETGSIGSLTFSSQLLSSAFAFMLERSVGFRPVIVVSTVLCAVGIYLSAIATKMTFLYLSLGLLYGSSSGICFHATICILLQHFPHKSTRPTAVMLLGATVGVLVYSQLLEVTLSSFGWRISLFILASLIIVPGLPMSFLIIPISPFPRTNHAHEEHITKPMGRKFSDSLMSKVRKKQVPDSSRKVDGSRIANYLTAVGKEQSVEYFDSVDEYTPWKEWSSSDISGSTSDDYCSSNSGRDMVKVKKLKSRKRSLTSLSWCGDCKVVLKMGRMWIFAVACVLSAMAWCVFFVNIGSFFDSVGLSLSETAFLLTVMAGMEIAGKTYLATVGESVPVAKIHFLIGQSVIMTSISVILIFAENYIAMIFLSIGKPISNLQSIDRKLLAATNTDIYLQQCIYPRCILKINIFVS